MGAGLYIYLRLHMLSARGDIHELYFAALIDMTCPVQSPQRFIQHRQDFSGQHAAESAQIVWLFFVILHFVPILTFFKTFLM